MTVVECPSYPIALGQISFTVTEFPDLDLAFSVFAMQLEGDSIVESFEP
jgi:hypothetical protein